MSRRTDALNGATIDSSDVSAEALGFYVPDGGATVDRLEINGDNTTNVLTDYVKTVGGVIPAGTTVMAANGDYFSSIQLTAGTVNPINR